MRFTPKRAAAWLFAEKVLRVLNGLVVTAAVARYLGSESYGRLAVAMGVLAAMHAAVTMGADHVNVSEFTKRIGAQATRYIASAVAARLVWTFACLAALWAGLALARPDVAELIGVLSFALPLGALGIFGDKLLAEGRFRGFALLSGCSILLGAAVRLAGIVWRAPLEFFAAAVVIETLAYVALFLVGVARGNAFRWRDLHPERAEAWSYFRLCLPTAISATLVVLDSRIELFLIGSTFDDDSVGVWAATQMFILPWAMVAVSIVATANRALAARFGDDSDYEHRLVLLTRHMLLLSCAAAALNAAAANVIVPMLLGDEFERAIGVTAAASAVLIPMFVSSVQEISIAHRRVTGVVLKKILVGLPLSAVLLLVLLPRYGVYGAAMGMVISKLTTAFALNLLFDREFLRIQLYAFGLRRERPQVRRRVEGAGP